MGAQFKFLLLPGRGPVLTTRFAEERSTFSIFFSSQMATLKIAKAAGRLGVTAGHRAGRAPRRWGREGLPRAHKPRWPRRSQLSGEVLSANRTTNSQWCFSGVLVISAPGVLPLFTFHPLMGREHGLGEEIRTRCVQNVPLLSLACPAFFLL